MVQIEIDGQPLEVKEGSTIIQAAHDAGTYIPHFCYHKKLSIAANCRMCLVEVEKAPKPVPSCATPVSAGMKVFTRSEKAVAAQKSVMEFLLINHPLDCPICDQGGECQLQDLTVGYGKSSSRYQEEKRVVFHKNVGPLISMEEMSRCIHCTRCVRFGQEVAGVMELGMLNRGEHSEITSFVGQTVDSELSGNMIDICPVGALTSKPFRYAARTWELGRKKSVSPHDSLGSNIIVQTKQNEVKRVVPLENESINECWISDKDRFAYEGLSSHERITKPMVKQNNEWIECDWQSALDYVADSLKDIQNNHGANAIAALAHPMTSLEELYLLQKLVKGMGSPNVETRLRQMNVSGMPAHPWLGMLIEDIEKLESVLIVGSFLRKDHPLLAARIRKVAKLGQKVMRLDSGADDWLMPIKAAIKATPTNWANALQEIAVAVSELKGVSAPSGAAQSSEQAKLIAGQLIAGERKAILIGNTTLSHPDCSNILAWANWIAKETGAKIGFLGEGANFVGAHLVGANGESQQNIQTILEQGPKAVLLMNLEPLADLPNPTQAKHVLQNASTVIAISSYQSEDLLELADVILPITPYTEQAGTFVNIAGEVQTHQASVRPLGEARPGWKVLRVLGGLVDLDGFNFNTVEEVKNAALSGVDVKAKLSNEIHVSPLLAKAVTSPVLERLSDVPIHFTDPIVRRSPSLRLTTDSKRAVRAGLPSGLFAQLGLKDGDAVKVTQAGHEVVFPATLEKNLLEGVVRISAATQASALLGDMFGELTVEKV